MEAAYRRAAVGKRQVQRTKEEQRGERRRLVQLLVSLCLFLVVFVGRNTFSAQGKQWEQLITNDADFSTAFEQFGKDLAEGESIWSALRSLTAASFGQTLEENEKEIEILNVPESKPVTISKLSESKQLGLAYYREHGLRDYGLMLNEFPVEDAAEEETPEVEIVTAVAQAYNANGEALPRNVSYERYELGLEKTAVPVMGTVTSGFEYRTSPITGKREFHLALDIAAEKGTEISAFADGVVRYIGESDDFGLYLMIDHANGVATFYAHCSELLVRKGDSVTCGETVALVGNTGNATGYHLHFTIEKDDIRLNPAYYVKTN